MKKWQRILLGAVLLFSLTAGATLADAHTMTLAEANLVLEEGNDIYGEIKPGDKLEQVSHVLGDGYKLEDFKGEGIRMVKYIYEKRCTFYGRTSARDASPAPELKVNGYTLKSNGLHTASGFAVGTSYAAVEEKFGEGTKVKNKYGGRQGMSIYNYDLFNGVKELSFEVDNAGLIKKITFRQEL